jgi:hypothetical protein
MAAVSTTMGLAGLHGMLTNQHEHSAAPILLEMDK